jgi:hypothetical protein
VSLRRALPICVLVFVGAVGCSFVERNVPIAPQAPLLPGQSGGVFTTARPTVSAALSDFFGRRPEPVQPIEFPHNIHVGKQIACTEYCHESVTTGPVAGLPSVRTCMTCHNTVATNRPRIIQITAMREKGLDLAWQRVYGYPAASHVKFNHAPHITAEVSCETCHGDVGKGTVATLEKDLTMGFCVNCHNEKKAPTDCMACHF